MAAGTDARPQGLSSADFNGAKLALYHHGHLIVLLRDDISGIAWPGYWDFPGGGREGDETPLACVLRELEEELSIRLDPSRILWDLLVPRPDGDVWFFVAEWDDLDLARVVLGDEGQRWTLMGEDDFLAHDRAVPVLKERLSRWITRRDGAARRDPVSFTES